MTMDDRNVMPGFPAVDEDTANATRDMFSAMLRGMLVLLAILLVAGTGIGWLVSGMPGVWAALIGCGIAAAFILVTVMLGQFTADKPVWAASGAVLGGWVAKMAILLIVVLAIRGQDFYDRYVLFGVMVIAILGTTGIEIREAMRARIPYTAPPPASRTTSQD